MHSCRHAGGAGHRGNGVIDCARLWIEIGHHLARTRALSPLATLRRGYAVVQDAEGHVVSAVGQVRPPAALTVRVTDGALLVDLREARREPRVGLSDDPLPTEESTP